MGRARHSGGRGVRSGCLFKHGDAYGSASRDDRTDHGDNHSANAGAAHRCPGGKSSRPPHDVRADDDAVPR